MIKNGRCLPDSYRLSDLLTLSLYYESPLFHVVSGDGTYLGSLDKEILTELDWEKLMENPTLGDIILSLRSMPEQERGSLRLDLSVSEDVPPQVLWDMFMEEPFTEIPLVDKDGKLTNLVGKEGFISRCMEFKIPEDRPFVQNISSLKRNTGNLNHYAYNVNSQHGEDGILEKIFELIGTTNRMAIEFGGWDGIFLSNIRNLILKQGFSGLFIEGDPERAAEGKKNYAGNKNVRFLEGYVGFRDNKPLDQYLREAGMPQAPDLISIDIDGYDYHVWSHLKQFFPRVVIIEYNPTIANEILFIPPEREDRLMGASALAMVRLGIKKGYSLAAVTYTNCIFVRDEEFEKLGIVDNSLGALRPRDSYKANLWMQSYDEQIYFVGDNLFCWSGKEFGSNQFIVKPNDESSKTE